jgi:lipopolysaccharide export system permease protein
MLFHSSIRQELARSFVATLVVLITVVMSMMLIRTLGLAAKGSVNPQDVIMLMGYSVLGHLSTIMTLSLFIAVTNTYSRMYRDSEMAVWFASGKGLAGFVSPTLRFAWPLLLAITALILFAWPWSAQQSAKLRMQYEQRGDLDRVSLGQFQENASGSRVFFVEAGNSDAASVPPSTSATASGLERQARNVFVSEVAGNTQVITAARSGHIDRVGGDQFVVLKDGQRTELDKLKGQVKLIEFEEYAVLANAKALADAQQQPAKAQDTLELIRRPTPLHLAELSWRIGLALAACNLLLLALLFSAVNPRAGRGFGIAFALLGFVVYYNMLNIGYTRIAAGQSNFASWLLGLHGSVFAAALLWLALRHHQFSWRQLLPRAKPSPA